MRAEWVIKKKVFQDLLKQLLYNRGIIDHKATNKQIDDYIKPKFTNLYDSSKLPDISKAVERIVVAKEKKEKVGIFADYDADGIPGAAFLTKAFNRLGIDHITYIPSRSEGYGLSNRGIDYLSEKGVSLIITIDLGIKNYDEAKYCENSGIDLIITDHHLPDDTIPCALAVINPKIKKSKYGFKELSGATVAYKLVEALGRKYPSVISESFLKWNLDLIAISTISDVVPLISENRILAKYGLLVMKKSKNLGIIELMKSAGIDSKKIDAYHIGYMLGPRINAPGRIGRASRSYRLLITDNVKEAKELAMYLEKRNLHRQQLMEKVQKEAIKKIVKQKIDRNKVITAVGKWSKGVLGPSASNLAQYFNRPVILFSKEDNVITGSARSIGDIDIFQIISSCSEYILKYGGHKGAAGLSIDMIKYDSFVVKLMKEADEKIKEKDLIKKYFIDLELDFKDINFNTINIVNSLQPYGMANPCPLFMTSGTIIEKYNYVGKEKNHLSMKLKHSNKIFKAIYFNYAGDKYLIKIGKRVDIVYMLNEDVWNGKKQINLKIIDLKDCNHKQ